MLNVNGPGFAGLYAGDVVRFYVTDGRGNGASLGVRTARVLNLLVFADHVQVNYAPCGYTVDARNFCELVRRGKRHIAADKAANPRSALDYPEIHTSGGAS